MLFLKDMSQGDLRLNSLEHCLPEKKQMRYQIFGDCWATTVYSLYPEEIMDVIRQAYDDKLIAPGMIHYSVFEKALGLGKDKCLERLKIEIKRGCLDDIHAAMSWWACFNEERKTISSSPGITKASLSVYSKRSSCQS
jgi:hypothetical protein